jgi:hypothetical protein
MTFDDPRAEEAGPGPGEVAPAPPRGGPSSRARLGALAGLVAAAVTAGAIVGFGIEHGGAARLFSALGRTTLGNPVVDGRAEQAAVTAVGVLVHAAQVTAIGVLFGLVAAHARGVRLALLAIVAAILAAVAQLALAPAVLRFGNAVTVFPLQRGQFVALYLLLAAGLGGGMRVAHLCLRLDERSS